MKPGLTRHLLVLLCLVALLAACAGPAATPNAAPAATTAPAAATTAPAAEKPAATGAKTTFGLEPFAEPQTLRLGFFVGSPLSIPFYIADQEGFFKELNIKLEYVTFTNGPAMMEANASWDMAGAGLGGTLNGMLGRGIKVIGISDYEKNLALLARPDSPLAKNPKDAASWKGTTWLYPVGTTAQATLVAGLEEVGLGLNDIESVNMDVASALTAFNGGQGDGLAVWNAVAFNAEDKGYVRLGDAGTLGFVAPCANLVTPDALANKRELVLKSWAVFHYTVEWMKANDANKAKSVQYYYQNTNDEGIKIDESIAARVMEWYRGPTLSEGIELFTAASPDAAGLYKTRDVLHAERDILVGLDFFISQQKYKPEDRVRMLDERLVDPSIAQEVKAMLDAAGLKY
jgi:ABC-type nitrate/sulfonate/bicarbonate transport system substrate-binding protein